MPSSKKCPDCKLCLDIIWKEPRRFFHCYLCDKYYDIINNELVVIDVDVELKSHLDMLVKQEEERINERFSKE